MRILAMLLVATLCSCGSTATHLAIHSQPEADALYVSWPILAKTGKPDLIFVNTVHLAEQEFFEAVLGELAKAPVVMMEGVHGTTAELQALRKGYDELAQVLGIATQHDVMKRDPSWLTPDVEASQLGSSLTLLPMRIRLVVLRFERQLKKKKIALKKQDSTLTEEMIDGQSRAFLRRNLAKILADESDPDPVLILFRNDHLLSELDAFLQDKDESIGPIAICYGAGHCADLIAKLRKKGWAQTSETWQRVFGVAPKALYSLKP